MYCFYLWIIIAICLCSIVRTSMVGNEELGEVGIGIGRDDCGVFVGLGGGFCCGSCLGFF